MARSSVWRRLTGWIAAFALVCQSLTAIATIAPAAAADAGFELCLHDGGAGGPAGPAKAPDASHPCLICFCGAAAASALAPPLAARLPAPPIPSHAAWAVVASALPTPTKPPHRSPRGPPREA